MCMSAACMSVKYLAEALNRMIGILSKILLRDRCRVPIKACNAPVLRIFLKKDEYFHQWLWEVN